MTSSVEGMKEVKEVVKPFDWTFTTNYMGTVSSKGGPQLEVMSHDQDPPPFIEYYVQVAETKERIDYAKLKTQERIYFYDEVILYEDELADNGTAVLSVKIVGHCCACHMTLHGPEIVS